MTASRRWRMRSIRWSWRLTGACAGCRCGGEPAPEPHLPASDKRMDNLNILLIVNTASERAGTIREHVQALSHLSRHRVFKIDNAVAHRVDFAMFDVIALHYSLVIASPAYISD